MVQSRQHDVSVSRSFLSLPSRYCCDHLQIRIYLHLGYDSICAIVTMRVPLLQRIFGGFSRLFKAKGSVSQFSDPRHHGMVATKTFTQMLDSKMASSLSLSLHSSDSNKHSDLYLKGTSTETLKETLKEIVITCSVHTGKHTSTLPVALSGHAPVVRTEAPDVPLMGRRSLFGARLMGRRSCLAAFRQRRQQQAPLGQERRCQSWGHPEEIRGLQLWLQKENSQGI